MDEEDIIEATTQLIQAAMLNNLPRVLQLIQLGAPLDVFDSDFRGHSALHWACELGHEHVAKALLDGKYEGQGATVDLRTKANSLETPLSSASGAGHEAIVRLLLSRGAKQELQDRFGFVALHSAVHRNHPNVVALLCSSTGASVALALTPRATWGSRTPLAWAIHRGHAACEAVLRAHGAPE
jgi:ankyrin repeat protein